MVCAATELVNFDRLMLLAQAMQITMSIAVSQKSCHGPASS